MKLPIILAVALSAGASAQQKKPATVQFSYVISAPGTGGWKQSKVSLSTLGARVDKAMKGIRNLAIGFNIGFEVPEGKGTAQSVAHVQSPKLIRAEFPVFDTKTPYGSQIRADGTNFKLLGYNGQWGSAARIPSKPPAIAPSKLVAGWSRAFPRMMISSIVMGNNLYSDLAKGFAQKASGYEARVEERVRTFDGQKIHNIRIYAKRSAASAAKLGPSTIEIVFDAKQYLPVTVRVNEKPKGQKSTTKAAAQWFWMPGKKYPAGWFRLPG